MTMMARACRLLNASLENIHIHIHININNHSSRSVNVRHKSGSGSSRRRRRNGRGEEVIEIEMEGIAVKRLEETIHKMVVKRAAPLWLPFRPGMSYWVPPPAKFGDVIEIAINSQVNDEDLESFSTARRGWPSQSYYIADESSRTVENIPEKIEKSEDDDEED